MLRVKRYSTLQQLPNFYEPLFRKGAEDSFFLSLPWFQNLEKTVLGSNESVEIVGVEEDLPTKNAVGALVLKTSNPKNGYLSCISVDSFTNYYTSYYEPIFQRGHVHPKDIAHLLADEICKGITAWDTLNLRPLDFGATATEELVLAIEHLGIRTQKYFCFGNWYLQVGSRSFSEYFRDLPNIIRKNVPYYRRRLNKEAKLRVSIYQTLEDVAVATRDYEVVYNSSWRDREAYPNFIRDFIYTAALQGWLRLGVLYINEEPAAAQLWIVHNGIASIYKICYAEKFSKYSAGSILTAHMLEHVLDAEKVNQVDYLTGDDPYKAYWMSDRRERWGIIAFNATRIRGQIAAIRHIGGRNLKARWNNLKRNVSLNGQHP
jgi:hypothetical protein